MAELRLQRFLAQAGVASRRKAEELILAGRVKVNGRVASELGTKIDPARDRVEFDGRRLVAEDHVWLLLNKPRGALSTVSDPEGRETVLDIVGPQGVRLYPVGRLDYQTEGVLLLTNDGDLAHALMHPRSQVQRVYHVKLKGLVDPSGLDALRDGVELDGGERAFPQRVHLVGTTDRNTWIELTLAEGKNREVHRIMEAVGLTVLKLVRVAYAGLTVEDLPPGRYRPLSQAEIDELRALVKLPSETRRHERPRSRRAARERPARAPRAPRRSERAPASGRLTERTPRTDRPTARAPRTDRPTARAPRTDRRPARSRRARS